MTKKELIDIAKNMDCDADYEDFYNFAKIYLSNPSLDKERGAQEFLERIKVFMNNSDKRTVQSVMGKRSGKNNEAAQEISDWCRYILSCEPIRELTMEELHYVVSYCARIAKIKKERI